MTNNSENAVVKTINVESTEIQSGYPRWGGYGQYGAGGPGGNDNGWNEGGPESLAAAFHATILFLRRQFWLLLAALVVGLLIAPLAIKIAPSEYRSTATILFDANRVRLFKGTEIVEDSSLSTAAGLDGEIQIMLSTPMLQQVLKKLNLHETPEFLPRKGWSETILGTQLAELLGRPVARPQAWIDAFQVQLLRAGLTIERNARTFAVNIQYSSPSPEEAAVVANALAQTYLDSLVDEKKSLNQVAGNWLKTRLEELRSQLEAAEGKIIAFRSQHNLYDQDGKTMIEKRIDQLNAELLKEKGRESEMQARHDRLAQIIKDYRAAVIKPAVPDVFKNPLVTKLRDQYLELEKREKEWSKRFGSEHQATAKLREDMRAIQESLLDEYRRLAQSYDSETAIARQRQREVETEIVHAGTELRTAQKALVKLRELEASAQTHKQLYDSFLSKYSDATNQQDIPVPKARIIEKASVPLTKNNNKTVKTAFLLIAASLGMGLGAAVMREFFDRSFRRVAEVEQQLDSKVLTIVPEVSDKDVRADFIRWRGMLPPTAGKRAIKRGLSLTWAPDLLPNSAFAASIRAIKLSLDQRVREAGCDVIGVTSPQPNEGATSTAAALAITSALGGAKTLLIDCDFAHPALTAQMAPSAELGLMDIILEQATLGDVVWTDQSTGLDFLPVTSVRGTRSDELLASAAMAKLIEDARNKYERIILDLPPLVPMVDVQMTRDLVNAYIGVVHWGTTNREVAKQAFERTPAFRGKLAGLVLNRVDLKTLHLYDADTARWFDKRLYSNYVIKPVEL